MNSLEASCTNASYSVFSVSSSLSYGSLQQTLFKKEMDNYKDVYMKDWLFSSICRSLGKIDLKQETGSQKVRIQIKSVFSFFLILLFI